MFFQQTQSNPYMILTVIDGMPAQPQPLSSVFWWGGGTALPAKLPLPNPETQVVQVSAGRTQKAAVTRNGRLFVWEVNRTLHGV